MIVDDCGRSGRLVALEKVEELDKAVGFGRSLRHKRVL